MPPNYESQSFWEDRFKTESHFEWLGGGQDTILPAVRSFLQHFAETTLKHGRRPLLLHIGAGTSTLSDDIVEEYHKTYQGTFDSLIVLNTDFAQEAVRRGLQLASGSTEVTWERMDLLSWKEILALKEKIVRTEGRKFELVVDKSTTDAISCRADMLFEEETLTGTSRDAHPLIDHVVSRSAHKYVFVHPAAVLALHLASLVESGGVWIALSYSSDRFPFLVSDVDQDGKVYNGGLDVRLFWELERIERVKVREGKRSEDVHAPEVFHYLYILRRTEAVLAME